jgi:hypothetical protein
VPGASVGAAPEIVQMAEKVSCLIYTGRSQTRPLFA